MGQQALDRILLKSDAIIKGKAPKIFRPQLNKRTHRYSVNKQGFKDQLSVQIDRIKEFASVPQTEIDQILLSIAGDFVSRLHTKLRGLNRAGFKTNFREGSSDSSFVCVITSDEKKSVFNLLGQIRAPLLKLVAKEIGEKIFGDYKNSSGYKAYSELSAKQQLILDRNRTREHAAAKRYSKRLEEYSLGTRTSKPEPSTFRVDKVRKKGLSMSDARKFDALTYYLEGYLQKPGVTTERSGGVSALGHEKQGGVAKVALDEIVNDIVGYLESDRLAPSIKIQTKVVSEFFNKAVNSLKLTKEVEFNLVIEGDVGEESFRANLGTSGQEAAEFNKGIQEIKKTLVAELSRIPWASIEGSTPFDKAVGSKIIRHAKKKFNKNITKLDLEPLDLDTSASISNIVIQGMKSPKVRLKPQAKQIQSPAKQKKQQTTSTNRRPRPAAQNWLSLINIMNQKLPQKVAQNMGAPGLVYRTGRFANSTKVVNIETTRDGSPSIVFDYQRDPYDVFDRTLGRSPWNTPARDPRALVDKSVREIARELAIGKFYTRRA